MDSMTEWLQSIGLERYATVFAENDIDLDVLPSLTDADLRDLGLSLGHRRKLLTATHTDRQRHTPTSFAAEAPSASSDDPAAGPQAERRQLTVMFCDLVGSTALSQQLDPEALRELMRTYQQVCGKVIERYDGHVAQYLGDGLMVYCGWPRAHEDDAERAVRASLEIVEAVKTVSAPSPLQVRVGIATGAVVVGETGGGDASIPKVAVGGTPNLAARLQALAGADQIVIASATHRLLGVAFEYADLGENVLKGIVEPVRAFQILRAARTEGRFEATHSGPLIQLVGREEEIAVLMRRWEQAKQGEGQVVLLSGEPGIGKSRIIQALRERIAAGPHIRLRYQCSPFHTNSALHPVIEQFERAAAFTRDDGAEQKLDKLEKLLREGGADITATAPLIAALLSLPAGRYLALTYSPQKQKEKTLEALREQVEGLSAKSPVLMMFEDVHWVDPTTQEVLDLIVSRLAQYRVLLVVTFRPEYSSKWTGQPHVTTMTLSRLSHRVGAQIVKQLTADKPLPGEVLEQILVKTDGVPLFVEELTKATLESGLLKDCGDRYELTGPLTDLAIPSTLQDSLMARLDRLAPVREVAQIGACIGREFPYELVSAVWSQGDQRLQDALGHLAQSELVSRRGSPPDATYTFKHALVQDAAYQSLLKRRRLELHASIARALEGKFPDVVEAEPELVAHHYTVADRPYDAIPYWLKAGLRALHRSALKESIDHLTRGLQLVLAIPDTPERDARELEFQALLGTAQMMWKGYANPATGTAYQRADALMTKVGDSPQQFAVLWGVWAYYLVQPNYEQTLAAAQRALAVAERSGDPGLLVQALSLNCVTMFWLGRYLEAKAYTERVLEIYDESTHGPQVWVYNHDAKNLCLIYAAHYLWMLGYPDRAARADEERAAQARRLGHPFLTAFGDMWGGSVWHYRADEQRHGEILRSVEALSREQGFPMWEAGSAEYQGWWLVQNGELERGTELLERAHRGWMATGAGNVGPYQRALLADAYSRAGRDVEAREWIDAAVEWVGRVDERCHEAEGLRLKGDILLRGRPSDEVGAEAAYLDSLRVARRQEAHGWELRTATSLARLWRSQGKSEQAHDLLAPIYNWFTEGFDTKDLREAEALLKQLR